MKFFATAVFLVLAIFSNAAQAQYISGFNDQSNGTFRVTTSEGVVIVADPQTQRIYIADINGAMHEVGFEQAIGIAEQDPVQRDSMRASFWGALTNPTLAGAFAIPFASFDYFHVPNNPCDAGANPGGWEEECTISGFGAIGVVSSGGDDSLEKPVDLEKVHALRPHLIENTGGAAFYSSGNLGNYNYTDGGGYVDYQRYYADDFNSWSRNRSNSCIAAAANGVAMVAAGVGAGVGCLSTPVVGVTAAVCAAGIVTTVALWANYAVSANACMSSYPGPGKW
ncbi:hypothetical protein LDO31_01340 [Luteimonas sp. XNQY3]|nr:hypothetical protein [Luteimonas sp. XNQY3]MCD9004898.1 hypothetical protein [Luteimonas sp. XNQY3]